MGPGTAKSLSFFVCSAEGNRCSNRHRGKASASPSPSRDRVSLYAKETRDASTVPASPRGVRQAAGSTVISEKHPELTLVLDTSEEADGIYVRPAQLGRMGHWTVRARMASTPGASWTAPVPFTQGFESKVAAPVAPTTGIAPASGQTPGIQPSRKTPRAAGQAADTKASKAKGKARKGRATKDLGATPTKRTEGAPVSRPQ